MSANEGINGNIHFAFLASAKTIDTNRSNHVNQPMGME